MKRHVRTHAYDCDYEEVVYRDDTTQYNTTHHAILMFCISRGHAQQDGNRTKTKQNKTHNILPT